MIVIRLEGKEWMDGWLNGLWLVDGFYWKLLVKTNAQSSYLSIRKLAD